MKAQDYTLTIEDVSKRLNKSTRTIHRYKDSGRLSHVVGASQGNPLFFSRSEVDRLAHELYPSLAAPRPEAEAPFWQRLERLEKLLSVLERNPLLDQIASMARSVQTDMAVSKEFEDALAQLADLETTQAPVDRHALGRTLVRLGSALLNT
jgi:hypothetical protein